MACGMRPLLPRLPLLVLPVALFLAFFHASILDIGNAGWLIRGTDNGENALGLHAFLHDPAPGLLTTHLLNAPDGVPLLFTDSNPLVTALAWPLRSLLPADAQLVGPWLLLCLFLQVYFAWRLLRDRAPEPLALWCGVLLLAALPTLFNRYIHANLFAHWLILWALDRFLNPTRARANPGWALLIALTAMIHSYLLVMVGAIWASAMLERFASGDRADRLRTVAESGAILAMVAAIAGMLGVFAPHEAAGNYGAFAMPLDALWNPGTPVFSAFLPAVEQRPGRGFEGFQYLGLGLLLALPLAAAIAWRIRPDAQAQAGLARLPWLVPALVALTLLAISNYPDVAGHKLPRLPLPRSITDGLDFVRASGRMFWPVAYVLVLVAIRTLYRLPRERAMLALAGLAAIQIADLAPMASVIRAYSAEADDRRLYVRTPDPRWDRAITAARDVAMVPGDPTLDLALFQEIAWRAAKQGKPVRSVYAARPAPASTARVAAEDRAFRAGRLVPGRLYVLAAGEPLPPALRPFAHRLDGTVLVLR